MFFSLSFFFGFHFFPSEERCQRDVFYTWDLHLRSGAAKWVKYCTMKTYTELRKGDSDPLIWVFMFMSMSLNISVCMSVSSGFGTAEQWR